VINEKSMYAYVMITVQLEMLHKISEWILNILVRCVISAGYDHHWGRIETTLEEVTDDS
jgi:uncharacterized membrane protein